MKPFLAKLMGGILSVVIMSDTNAEGMGKLVFEMTAKSVIPGIAISNDDGTNLRMLAERGGNPKWFPSGEKVAYYLTREIGNGGSPAPYMEGKTLIVDLNGNLIKEIPYWVSDIHSNGNHMLVQKILHYENFWHETTYEVGIYDLQTDRYTALFSPEQMPKGLHLVTPASAKWFPDGKRVLINFMGERLNSEDVPYLGEFSLVDGTFKLLKIPGISVVFWDSFDISPDATKVIFSGIPIDHYEKPAIYVFNLKSHSVTFLHREGDARSCGGAVWSNDGRRILFNMHIPGEIFGSEDSLKIMNEDGTNVKLVFISGVVHSLWNTIGGTVPGRKEHADWWQPQLRPNNE